MFLPAIKPACSQENDFREYHPKSICNYLHYQLIKDGVETNRMKLWEFLRISNFRDENKKSTVKSLINRTTIENTFNLVTDRFSYVIPLILKESGMETITTWAFRGVMPNRTFLIS